MPQIDSPAMPERSPLKPSANMYRKQRDTFLQVSSYALFACVLFVVGKIAWSEWRCNAHNISNESAIAYTPFAFFATLHLPFATQPPQVVHLGTDVLTTNTPASPRSSKIGKCTVTNSKHDPIHLPALDSHLRHSEINHYPIFVLDRPTTNGSWTKEAALLAVLLQEMSKPEAIRLRWIMWFDANTLVINPLIPVEAFLPPAHLGGINLLVTENWNGLNSGVFLLRVSAWSVDFLTNILSHLSFKPDEDLPFAEKSAMERMIQDPRYASACIYVPPRWFNSYPRDEDESWTNKYPVQKGDMMLRFAGVSEDRPRMISAFYDHVVSDREEWEVPLSETTLPEEIAGFWRNFGMQRGLKI
jgi:hypothetical protein